MRIPPHRRATRTLAALAAAAAVAIIAACSTPEPLPFPTSATPIADGTATTAAETLLTKFGYDATSVRQLIDDLDATTISQQQAGLVASVQPDQLLLTTGDGETASLPMPDDSFYVSIAPYINATHECHYHSLTTCRGELANTTINIAVRDTATGKTLIDEARTTYDNGFIGLWLPRDITAAVDIDYQGKHATATIDTAADSPTCITTMRFN